MVRHIIPYFCDACTGAPQNAYFCGEDSVEHHPCATEYIYWCATEEVFPTSVPTAVSFAGEYNANHKNQTINT
jgi:hypothetical protein